MTNFQNGMRIRCGDCGEQAQMHRLTDAGVLYCLKLKKGSPSLYKFLRWETVTPDRERRVAMRVTVRDLVRGEFPHGLGKAIHAALTHTTGVTA